MYLIMAFDSLYFFFYNVRYILFSCIRLKTHRSHLQLKTVIEQKYVSTVHLGYSPHKTWFYFHQIKVKFWHLQFFGLLSNTSQCNLILSNTLIVLSVSTCKYSCIDIFRCYKLLIISLTTVTKCIYIILVLF